MLIVQIAEPSLLRVRVDGDLLAEDCRRCAPQLDALARQHSEPMPVLVELGPQLSVHRLRALWQQVLVDPSHRRLLGAVAVVGEPGWAFPTHLAGASRREPVRFFKRGEEAQAEAWLRQHETGSTHAADRSAEA